MTEPRNPLIDGACAMALLALVACDSGACSTTQEPAKGEQASANADPGARETASATVEETWDEMVAVEEGIRALEPLMRKLDKGVLDLALPGAQRELFAERVRVKDVGGPRPEPDLEVPHLKLTRHEWKLASEREVERASLQLWSAVLEPVSHFYNAKFHIDTGEIDEARTRLRSQVSFAGLAELKTGGLGWIRAMQELEYVRPSAESDGWRIKGWRTTELSRTDAPKRFFREVLDGALRNRAQLERARRSLHEELIVQAKTDKEAVLEKERFFTPPALDRHPGVSVVDLDRDGFDDIYLMARWGENQFFHNRGDGTFVEQAARRGLDIDSYTSSAIFADFDNDGDADAYIGRTNRRSRYLVNEGGRFVDKSDTLPDGARPFFASSISAVDYDNDGLLDIYVSTYATHPTKASFLAGKKKRPVLHEQLEPADAKALLREMQRGRTTNADLAGPPNVLLRNVGDGRFEVSKEARNLRVLANTYQSTWADFDKDGDADVYVANDFGPNQLFRNEGNGAFHDVTAATETADIGFGMGATWGDYDGDGRQDLYVSNMYSYAGNRITGRLGLKTYQKIARGNTLFRNRGESFEHVSGLEPPAMLVEAAGWSWGGQFMDFDNDADLDIVVLSGYFSAPEEFALPVDA